MKLLKYITKWLVFPLAVSVTSPVIAQNTISGSAHDMTTQGTAGTTEICVFCHTPHGSDTNAIVPLWNRFLDTSRTYTQYSNLGTATLDGSEAPVGSVSLACLSCHDGQQARDSVINLPGSGGYNALGSTIPGATLGVMPDNGTPIPMLGTDLQDDHPVSIQYAGGACQGTSADCTPTAANGDPDFKVAQYEEINTKPQWWVDTETTSNDTRNKTDMILYARNDWNGVDNGTLGPSVECGSCHDPHEAQARPVSFLRMDNAGSAICLACHTK